MSKEMEKQNDGSFFSDWNFGFKKKETKETEYTASGGAKVLITGVLSTIVIGGGKALFEHVSKKGWF